MRSFRTAQHEAAHVVVGCAMGLRLVRAWVNDPMNKRTPSATQFAYASRSWAFGVMYSAGIAWEIVSGGDLSWARTDRRLARGELSRCGERADIRGAVACAEAILHSRMALHARVSRLLAERDITGADVRAIVERG